jgi:S1-C subfamily serine protease
MVKRIAPGSSAEASSLQSGDIITSFDDRPVNKQSITDLKRALGSGRDSVQLCWRSGDERHCEELPLASRFAH